MFVYFQYFHLFFYFIFFDLIFPNKAWHRNCAIFFGCNFESRTSQVGLHKQKKHTSSAKKGKVSLSPVKTDVTLLVNNSQHCWMLHVASVCTLCCMLLDVVACCCATFETGQTFQPATPNISFVPWSLKRSAKCWIRLHSSSNIFGTTDGCYAWFTKTYGLYPSHDALQVLTLLGVVASVCTPLPTCTQQLPTLLVQQCWELLRSFGRSLREHYDAMAVKISENVA